MIKIEKYRISNYKNIAKADLSFGPFNVIVGENNSGKSNLIQSLSFLNYLFNGPIDELEKYFDSGFGASPFGEIRSQSVNYDDNTLETVFEIEYSNLSNHTLYRYILAIKTSPENLVKTSTEITKEILSFKKFGTPGKMKTIFDRGNNGFDEIRWGQSTNKKIFSLPPYLSMTRFFKLIPSEKEQDEALTILTQLTKTPVFYFSNTELKRTDPSVRQNIVNWRVVSFDLEDEIIALKKEKSWNIFKDSIKSVLNIDDVFIHSFKSEPSTKEDNKSKGEFKVKQFVFILHNGTPKQIHELSDGSLLILALITKVLNSKESIIIIEEPENSTHPKALVDLLNFIHSFEATKQFIITSHSIAVVNRTPIDQIITSCVQESGLSEIVNASSKKELRKKLNSGFLSNSDQLFFNASGEDEFE